MQSEMADFNQGATTRQLWQKHMNHLWHHPHPQNWKYITHCFAIRSTKQWPRITYTKNWTSGFWDVSRQTDRHADQNTLHPYRG